jgi:2',3'-cyclic-nucleotide 2'-phosphodiesterase (5'-nucleotidase family)
MRRGAGIATELRQLADKVVVLIHEDVRDQRAAEEDHKEIEPEGVLEPAVERDGEQHAAG